MKRIRLFFLALAGLLLLVVGLLVDSAVKSAKAERQVRHMALAERILDEMERELSAFLAEEEERPTGHYGFYYVPEGLSAAGPPAMLVSPLASPPKREWVLGYFQIAADGGFTTPRVPHDLEDARKQGDWHDPPGTLAEAAELERLVAASLPGSPPPPPDPLAAANALAPRLAAAELLEAVPELADEADPEAGLAGYRALRELNRGAKTRPKKMLKLRVSKGDVPDTVRVTASVEQPGGEVTEVASARLRLRRQPTPSKALRDLDEVLGGPSPEPRAQVLPLMGRVVDGRHLLLTRAVVTGRGRLLQGALLDVGRLTAFLEESVFGEGSLAKHTRRQFFLASEPAPTEPAEQFSYLHRFAQPFEPLAVRLSIDPLRQGRSALLLYAIAGLLVVTAAGGLYALYRMVAVTVRFAERRSNFVAAVSHELKTPLTSIRLYAEMLRDGMVESDDTRHEYYSTITNESERLTRLIDNVLQFSRLEQGTRDVDLVCGEVGSVVAEAARSLEPHAGAAGFRLEVSIEDGLPPVRFDRDAVVQVVFNLVDNALKYARDASDRVIVLRCHARDGGVGLSVRDWGPGVPQRHLSKIFEAFYRGEDELTRRARGTGIGLALVKGLAERMGAAVSGQNAAEGGFEVSLLFRRTTAE